MQEDLRLGLSISKLQVCTQEEGATGKEHCCSKKGLIDSTVQERKQLKQQLAERKRLNLPPLGQKEGKVTAEPQSGLSQLDQKHLLWIA